MAGGPGHVPQYRGPGVRVIDYHVQQAIPVQVTHGQAPSPDCNGQTASRRRRHAPEASVSQVAEQQNLLRVTGSPSLGIDDRVHMAVGYYQILPAIVVEIQEARPPAQKRQRGFAVSGMERNVPEHSFAFVVVQRVRLV